MWVDSLLGLVAPLLCKGCKETSSNSLCNTCLEKITNEPYERCITCENLTTVNNLCRTCQIISPLTRVFVVGKNTGVLKRLVYDYKFHSERRAAGTLVKLLDEILPILPTNTIVVPIPTIQNHIRQRGFGHTELVAKLFAKQRHLPYRQLLTRTNNTVMHGLKASERKKAIKNAFITKKLPRKITGILLIDDIYTTGTTVNEATKLLKSAGAKEVNLAIIARHPKK